MRLRARLFVVAGLAALVLPGQASAAVQNLVFNSALITVTRYEVARGVRLAPSPKVDGHVVGMSAEVVGVLGNPISPMDVMLHHVVFAKLGVPDYTCSSLQDYTGNPSPFPAERFYAEGEERFSLALPAGYGYPNCGQDAWGLLEAGLARYQELPRRPGLQRARDRQPRRDPLAHRRLPHAGERALRGGRRPPPRRRRLARRDQYELWLCLHLLPDLGLKEPHPVLHEPGPLHMTGFADPAGRPVQAGDTVRLTARYDNSRPHVRVMGIVMLYFVPGASSGCAAYSSPVPAPSTADRVTIELLKRPLGPVRQQIRSTWVGDYAFGAQRVSLRPGSVFTWRFFGGVEHDVTLASGPVGFASPSMARGTYSFRFTRPGTYRLFCSLHPARMTQMVIVR